MLLVLLGLVVAPAAGQAAPANAPVAGRFTVVRGQAAIVAHGRTAGSPAAADQPLRVGDAVETGINSRTLVLLADDTQLKINNATKIRLVAAGPPAGTGPSVIFLDRGEIWTKGRKGPNTLIIQTPAATTEIQGTDWFTKVDDRGRTVVLVHSGTVRLYNDSGTVAVSADEMAAAEPGRPPTTIRIVNPRAGTQWVSFTHETLRHIYFSSADRAATNAELAALHARPDNAFPLRIRQAELLHDSGRLHDSLALLQQLNTENPADPRLQVALALLALRRGDWQGSRAALALVPDDFVSPVLALVRAAHLVHDNRFESARAVLTAAREQDRANVGVAAGLVNLLLLEGRDEEAIRQAQADLAAFPDAPVLTTFLVDAYLLADRQVEARAVIDRTLARYPQAALAHLDLALLLDKAQGRENEALAAYQQALALAPDEPLIIANLANLYRQLGEYDRGLDLFTAALAHGFRSTALLYHYGLLLMQIDNSRAAAKVFLEADTRQGEISALSGAGLALLKMGRAAEARTSLLQATMMEPGLAENFIYLAIASYQLGMAVEALDALDHAAEADPRDSTPHIIKSMIYNDRKEHSLAIAEAKQAEERLPYRRRGAYDLLCATKEGLANVAFSLRELGLDFWSFKKSLDILAADPYDPNAHLLPSAILTNLGNGISGQSEFTQGIMMDPSAIVEANRCQPILKVPAHYTTSELRIGAEGGRLSNTESVKQSGYFGEPYHLNYSLQLSRAEQRYWPGDNPGYLNLRENGLEDHTGIVSLLGWQPAHHSDLYSRVVHNATAIRSAIYTDKLNLPYSYLAEENSSDNRYTLLEGGLHHQWSPTNHLLVRPYYTDYRAVADGSGTADPFALYGLPFHPLALSVDSSFATRETGIQSKHFFSLGPNQLSYGLEGFERTLDFTDRLRIDTPLPPLPFAILPPAVGADIEQRSWKLYARDAWRYSDALLFDAGISWQSNWVESLREDRALAWCPRLGAAFKPEAKDTFRLAYQKNVIPWALPVFWNLAGIGQLAEGSDVASGMGVGQLESTQVAGIIPYEFMVFGLTAETEDFRGRWEREWNDRFFHFVELGKQRSAGVGEFKSLYSVANWMVHPRVGLQAIFLKVFDLRHATPPFALDLLSQENIQFKCTVTQPNNIKVTAWYEFEGQKESYFAAISGLPEQHRVNLRLDWESASKRYGVSLFWFNVLNNRETLDKLPYDDSFAFVNFQLRL